MARERVDLVLHTGDISYPVFEDGQIDLRCFGAYEPHMRGVPYFFTVGNHDFYNGDQAYLEAFWLPTNSVTGTEHYYSFDQGDAHFVSLFVPWHGVSQFGKVMPDGSRSAPYQWLTNDLAGSSKPWKLVFFHQPIRTSGPHILDDYDVSGRSDIHELREALLPALASSGVQLVFMGHDHAWERFAPHQRCACGGDGGWRGGAVSAVPTRRGECAVRVCAPFRSGASSRGGHAPGSGGAGGGDSRPVHGAAARRDGWSEAAAFGMEGCWRQEPLPTPMRMAIDRVKSLT
jgi:hypothetical protein